jgi:hypothetical protein
LKNRSIVVTCDERISILGQSAKGNSGKWFQQVPKARSVPERIEVIAARGDIAEGCAFSAPPGIEGSGVDPPFVQEMRDWIRARRDGWTDKEFMEG